MYSLESLSQISPASNPLTLDAYITYFLAPHIIATFVAEDMNEDLEGGWEAMQRANGNRRAFNKLLDDDPELEDIFQQNAIARMKANRPPAKPQPFPGRRIRPPRCSSPSSQPTAELRQTRASAANTKAVKIVTSADFPAVRPTPT